MFTGRTFRQRGATVKAIQYTGTIEAAELVREWTNGQATITRYSTGAFTVHVRLRGVNVTVQPGDFIAKDANGRCVPWNPVVFDVYYEEVRE